MKTLLISACLLGVRCRYDGGSKPQPGVEELAGRYRLIPVCPEVFGGLPVPRTDAQRRGSSVVTRDGRDVTGQYFAGAEEAVRLALEHRVVCAIMKEKSPSCGSSMIYDGSFSGELIEGEGLASELLRKAGVRVFSENQLDEVEKLISDNEVDEDV